jgi:GTP-binding protein
VPVGTIATNEKGQVVADLVVDGQSAVIAAGGRGGFGNAHFVSSRRQAPKFAEKGEPGESYEVALELKMIADVGLIGLPNAGKSTLLGRISNARPEIADYPFTTLRPNLGVVDIDGSSSLLFADIPGLIEGAAEGKGLGHDFLRHVERTPVLLHLIDAYQKDIGEAYRVIRTELEAYQSKLAKHPEIVVLTKVEGLDKEIIADLSSHLQRVVAPKTPIFAISAQSGEGLSALLYEVKRTVDAARKKRTTKKSAPSVPVLTLHDTAQAWQVARQGKLFVVTGPKIEQFAKRTEFKNDEAVQRLRDIMKRYGILHELVRQGIEPGQTIQVGETSGRSFPY